MWDMYKMWDMDVDGCGIPLPEAKKGRAVN
jgi:hypothetical protein